MIKIINNKIGGKKTRTNKYKKSKKNKILKTRKTRQAKKTRKGGFLGTMSLGINGINLSRTTGQKRYNWKTGKLDHVTCYGIGEFKWCKLPEEK